MSNRVDEGHKYANLLTQHVPNQSMLLPSTQIIGFFFRPVFWPVGGQPTQIIGICFRPISCVLAGRCAQNALRLGRSIWQLCSVLGVSLGSHLGGDLAPNLRLLRFGARGSRLQAPCSCPSTGRQLWRERGFVSMLVCMGCQRHLLGPTRMAGLGVNGAIKTFQVVRKTFGEGHGQLFWLNMFSCGGI